MFDIITPDLMSGPVAAGAEILAVADNCLDTFPSLAQMYEIHVSHSNSAFSWDLGAIFPNHDSSCRRGLEPFACCT